MPSPSELDCETALCEKTSQLRRHGFYQDKARELGPPTTRLVGTGRTVIEERSVFRVITPNNTEHALRILHCGQMYI